MADFWERYDPAGGLRTPQPEQADPAQTTPSELKTATPAATTTTPATDDTHFVQLAALAAVAAGSDRLALAAHFEKKAGIDLGIREAFIDKQRYVLVTSASMSKAEADGVCAAVKEEGNDCLVKPVSAAGPLTLR